MAACLAVNAAGLVLVAMVSWAGQRSRALSLSLLISSEPEPNELATRVDAQQLH